MTTSLIPPRETLEIEFKSDRDPLNDDDLIEALICLANAQGGTLYLGVENDGAVTGLHASRPVCRFMPKAFCINNFVLPSSRCSAVRKSSPVPMVWSSAAASAVMASRSVSLFCRTNTLAAGRTFA